MAKALENVKVLDFTRFLTGPVCTMMLRELGAEVIKVEIPDGGDGVRHLFPATEAGEGYMFVIVNRGKKSITLNLKSDKGREIARELVKKVDVTIENFSTGVTDRLGLGYEELRKINPSLIYASITGFGHTGPEASGLGYDMIAQARGGLMSLTGNKDGPPIRSAAATADYLGGVHATISIQAALLHREKTGEGQAIDISLQDGIWNLTAIEHAGYYFLTGKAPPRLGNEALPNSPSGSYATNDGWIVLNAPTDDEWGRIARAIGREELITNPKYAAAKERVKNREDVNAILSEWTKERTMAAAVRELSNARVACSEVPTFDQVANDPQLLSREMIVEVEQPLSGKLKVPGSVFKLSKTPGDPTPPAPRLGQHNYEVYSGLLGYSEQEIKKLGDDGII